MLSNLSVRARLLAGLTLPELLIIVAILGVTSFMGMSSWVTFSRRERLNSLALEVAGWIEEVRNQAANQVSQTDTLGGCAISFTNSLSSAGPGSVLAEIKTGTTCPGITSATLKIPNARGALFRLCSNMVSCGGGSGSAEKQDVTFTPRGMIKASPSLGASSVYEYRVVLSDNRGPKRCIRISDITGSVQLGYGSDSSLATSCSAYGGL